MKNSTIIENYCNLLEQGELEFLHNSNTVLSDKSKSSKVARVKFVVFCLVDFLILHLKFLFQNNKTNPTNIVFIFPNLCRFNHNSCSVPILEPLQISNPWYVNYGKERYISKINNRKVYNLGGLQTLLQFFNKSTKSASVNLHRIVNDSFLKNVRIATVYTLCYYDNNGLSLTFSKYRKNFNFTEVQHGSMINFYPYQNPANFPVVDTFFVRNTATIQYLKTHVAKNYSAHYHLIPYPKNNAIFQEGIYILYASSIETNGFHPVFLNFLKNNTHTNLNVIVRLHPREFHNKPIFETDLKKWNIQYSFDTSQNWLLANTIQNLIVVSPWSSMIEEAIDNGYKAIIIDEMGKKRFNNYIDNVQCFYTNDIAVIVSQILE